MSIVLTPILYRRKLRPRTAKLFCGEMGSGLPKDTQLVNGRARILIQVVWHQNPCSKLHHYIISCLITYHLPGLC